MYIKRNLYSNKSYHTLSGALRMTDDEYDVNPDYMGNHITGREKIYKRISNPWSKTAKEINDDNNNLLNIDRNYKYVYSKRKNKWIKKKIRKPILFHFSIMDPDFDYYYQKLFGLYDTALKAGAKAYDLGRTGSIKAHHFWKKLLTDRKLDYDKFKLRVDTWRDGLKVANLARNNIPISDKMKELGQKALNGVTDYASGLNPVPLVQKAGEVAAKPGTKLKQYIKHPSRLGKLMDLFGTYIGAGLIAHGDIAGGLVSMCPGSYIAAGQGLEAAYKYIPGLKPTLTNLAEKGEKPLNYISDKITGLIHKIKRKK